MDYEKQADDFCAKNGVSIKWEYIDHKKHFNDDTDERAIWKFTIKRGEREYSSEFGQSLNDSWGPAIHCGDIPKHRNARGELIKLKFKAIPKGVSFDHPKGHRMRVIGENSNYSRKMLKKQPTSYDLLAYLTKNDPHTFESFCMDCGYDTDSRKAEKTYTAVCEEWRNVERILDDAMLEELKEIA